MKAKNILFICKEEWSWPMIYMAQRLKADNNVALYFIVSHECALNEYKYNQTYYYAKKIPDVQVFSTRDSVLTFTKNIKSPKVDYQYLEKIERTYSNYCNLNLQYISMYNFSTAFHYRNMYAKTTDEQRLYWVELIYQNTIGVIEEFCPDVIFDINNEHFNRMVLTEVCQTKGIPYVNINYSRVENYVIPTYNNSIKVDDYFVEDYRAALQKSPETLVAEYQFIHDFQSKAEIMAKMYKGTATAKYMPESLYTIARRAISNYRSLHLRNAAKGNRAICRKNPILFPPLFKQAKYLMAIDLKNRWLLGKNSIFESPVKGEKYVYMPLHLIPEASTAVIAPLYLNELNNIEMASKSLPIGWKLYVKEHQSMLGERSIEFYKKVKQILNVRLVQPNYYHDPKPWIVNSQGVITITGTSAFEAALLGKRSVVMGAVPYAMIEGVEIMHSFSDLRELFQSFSQPLDNLHSCAAYINTVWKNGKPIDIDYLRLRGQYFIFNHLEISEEYDRALEELLDFFENGYAIYNKYKH